MPYNSAQKLSSDTESILQWQYFICIKIHSEKQKHEGQIFLPGIVKMSLSNVLEFVQRICALRFRETAKWTITLA